MPGANGKPRPAGPPPVWLVLCLAWLAAGQVLGQLPPTERLSTVAAVRRLSATDAARGVPVEIRGQVTYYERRWDTLFIQDSTSGCYVYSSGRPRPEIQAGQMVTVRGRTRLGGGPAAAHSIQEEEIITEDGLVPFPAPVRPGFNELAAGRADSLWIEVEGVVRVLWSDRDRFEIDLVVDGGRIRCYVPRPAGAPLPQELLHARVRVRGACGLALSERGTLQGVRLFCPGLSSISVVAPAVAAEAIPARPLGQLSGTTPALVSPARWRVEGTVTCATPGGPLFLQDGDAGLEVALCEPRALVDSAGSTLPSPEPRVLRHGDWAAVLGYPASRGGRILLEEAELIAVGKGTLPVPLSPTSADWGRGTPDMRLVRVEGRVVHELPPDPGRPDMRRFVLQWENLTADVLVPGPFRTPLDPQNLIRVTGVASAELDEMGLVRGWQLWLRDGRDVEVLSRPWFGFRMATPRMLLLTGAVLLALGGWALFLWRQLDLKRLQTVELEGRIAARNAELEQTNASLRREVWERSRASALQAAIYRISEATHSVGDLPELYRQLHEIIGTLMPARNFYIALYDRTADILSFPYYADEKSGAPDSRPWSHGLSEYVIRRREPLLADGSRLATLITSGDVRQIGPVAQVWLGVPLIVNGRAMGLMAVQDYSDPEALTAEHQRILTYVAGQTATAIERKRAESALRASQEALRASQQRFRSAFASSPALMTLARLNDGVLFEVNEAFLSTLGLSREDVLGRSSTELGLWGSEQDRMELVRELREHGSVRGREVPIRLRDGRERVMLLSAELVEIDGEPSILVAGQDVTERKAAEEQLRRALVRERELGELKSNFVSLVSHEFRTPLEVILSSAEILERYHQRLAPAQRTKQLRSIRDAVRRMAEMMNEVLLLGRFEAGRVEFHPAGLNLPSFQRRMREEIVAAAGPGAVIELRAGPDLEGALADEGLLGHIFTNLLSNAVKYSPPGVPVEFVIEREGSDAVFTVTDRGCGIPAADQRRLFQSFHRGSNVGQRSGTGLGLVIVKRCVERHGGTISFVSREGEGSTFTVRLPLFEMAVEGAAAPDAAGEGVLSATAPA